MNRPLACGVFVVAVVLASIWPTLTGQRIAFRDVSHFYLPLYDYVASRTVDQWLPLWNPMDQTGMPLVGETSTAVLYPLRYAVYLLPVSATWAINLYLALHLLLASATAAWMARSIGCRPTGVVVAALVYPLSGSVFSLCCNPPFLVGAAWIPLALGACVSTRSAGVSSLRLRQRIILAAVALSMMVLGGDPQSALHCALTVFAIALLSARSEILHFWRNGTSLRHSLPVQAVCVCASACVIAAGLSAIQIAASLDWSRQSSRIDRLDERREVYEFSLAPWHTLELVSARPLGHPFPINRGIARLIPAEGRMWTPSIYAGLVVGFALLCRLARPRSYLAEPWLVVSVVSLLLCLGHFGLVWLFQQIPGVLPETNSAIGGPYWMLVHLIPGYSSFRYPVKWLPIFAIASSMVAAQWVSSSPARLERAVAGALATLFLVGASVSHLLNLYWDIWYPNGYVALPVDEYWGPLDVHAGFALIRASCLWSFLALLALMWLRHLAIAIGGHSGKHKALVGWTVFVALDCFISASSLLPMVDMEREQQVLDQARVAEIPDTRTLRTQAGMWPMRWRESSSPDRVLEVAVSERTAWFGRWHLAERRAVFNSMVSIQSHSYGEFWAACRRNVDLMDRQQRRAFWVSVRQWLAIGAVSHVDGSRQTPIGDLSLVSVDRRLTEPVQTVRVFTNWMPEKPLSEIVSEISRSSEPPLPHVATERPIDGMQHRATLQQADDGTLRVQCSADCLLERCVFQDGNWHARLVSQSDETSIDAVVMRSSHLNQAVRVPRGDWTIRFEYRPWWITWATTAMILALLLLGLLLFLPNQMAIPSVRGIVFFRIPGRLSGNKS